MKKIIIFFKKSVDSSLFSCYTNSCVKRGWRNWQTRRTKDPVIALDRVGSSPTLRISGLAQASPFALSFLEHIVVHRFLTRSLFSINRSWKSSEDYQVPLENLKT